MDPVPGQIVISKSGRDKGRYFIILSVADDYVYIVDGDLRKVEKPKKKKIKHLSFLNKRNENIGQKILEGKKVSNADIRKALEEYRI